MTTPVEEFEFVSQPPTGGAAVAELGIPSGTAVLGDEKPQGYPPAILVWPEEAIETLKVFLDERIRELDMAWQAKRKEWANLEKAYRARPEGRKSFPFEGADPTIVPAIAMAVDPIHARLDTGVFKQKPVYQIQALKRSIVESAPALTAWIEFYQKHKMRLRQEASPRLLELAKLGTCVFKTVYHSEKTQSTIYDENWQERNLEVARFEGPKAFGISLGDIMFDATYQHLQRCPIIIERQRTTYGALLTAQQSGQLEGVEALRDRETTERTEVEEARDDATGVKSTITPHDIVVYEAWFDYNYKGRLLKLVATYELHTRTLLQLRHNWYFHQRWPYTAIPYMVTNDSILGIGIAEMVSPFQNIITRFQQMASDNAYLANIRMFIAKKDSGIEEIPRLYPGRTFFVDEPTKDFIPFAAAEVYPSTIVERQNLFGMVEKRTGVSDYLTGRESPIVGTRATATSTLALIREGLARVEEVMENIRIGFAEIMENCIYIWIQYGLGDTKDLVFGDDEIGDQLDQFFRSVSREDIAGAIAIDLSVTDASTAPQAMQAMQLQIIQVMMQYLEKVLQAGMAALQAIQAGQPEMAAMLQEVMRTAKQMFRDLLNKYDVRNPEDYLPDLEKYLQGAAGAAAQGAGGVAGADGSARRLEASSGIPGRSGTLERAGVPRPAAPGAGGGAFGASTPARSY
jgi:hypothetical protein